MQKVCNIALYNPTATTHSTSADWIIPKTGEVYSADVESFYCCNQADTGISEPCGFGDLMSIIAIVVALVAFFTPAHARPYEPGIYPNRLSVGVEKSRPHTLCVQATVKDSQAASMTFNIKWQDEDTGFKWYWKIRVDQSEGDTKIERCLLIGFYDFSGGGTYMSRGAHPTVSMDMAFRNYLFWRYKYPQVNGPNLEEIRENPWSFLYYTGEKLTLTGAVKFDIYWKD